MDLFAIFDSCYQALPGCFLHALTCSTCCSLCSSCPAQVRTITNGSCSSSQVKFVITTKHFFNINRFLRNVMKCNTSIRLIPISLASFFFFFWVFVLLEFFPGFFCFACLQLGCLKTLPMSATKQCSTSERILRTVIYATYVTNQL